MDVTLYTQALVLGIVEGLTEFLPISSTGHLIVVGSLIDFTGPKAKIFEIAIQTGAMCAVLWQYRQRFAGAFTGFWRPGVAQRFVVNLVLAFMPAVVLGLIFAKSIKALLFHPVPVAVAFIVGGLLILWIEARHQRRYGQVGSTATPQTTVRVQEVDDMRWTDALTIGAIQCLALIPGTSRSGSTIMGGLLLGCSRKAAAEFSFFLGVPTLMGAGVYDLYRNRALLDAGDIPLFLWGIVVSAISALLCIRWLIRYVSQHDFRIFAWYRIVFGVVVLLTAYYKWVGWQA